MDVFLLLTAYCCRILQLQQVLLLCLPSQVFTDIYMLLCSWWSTISSIKTGYYSNLFATLSCSHRWSTYSLYNMDYKAACCSKTIRIQLQMINNVNCFGRFWMILWQILVPYYWCFCVFIFCLLFLLAISGVCRSPSFICVWLHEFVSDTY